MPLKPKSVGSVVAFAFGVSVWLCMAANGQTGPDERDLNNQRDQFLHRAFTTCKESPGSYYMFFSYLPELSCPNSALGPPTNCQALMEIKGPVAFKMKPLTGEGLDENGLTPADQANGITWRGCLTANYRISRWRHISDGIWEPWEPWLNREKGNWNKEGDYCLERIWRQNGRWSEEIGPDVLKTPYFAPSIGWLKEKASCADIENVSPPPASTSKPLSGFAVTTRPLPDPDPDAPKKCEVPTGTLVAVVSDAPQLGKAKVSIVNGNRDTSSCSTVLLVSEDDIKPFHPGSHYGTTHPAATASQAPGHLLSDTYARTLEVAADNANGHVPDSLDKAEAESFMRLYACYSIDSGGTCQPSGDTVRFPGDLANPLDWNAISSPGYCRSRPGVEVVLKEPVHHDGKRRFMRCVDIAILAGTRKQLMELGVRDDLTGPSTQHAHNQVIAGQPSAGTPFTVIKIPRTETTVGSNGLQLLALPKRGYPVAFTVPANTAILIDAKTPDGWLHIVAKPSKEHWTPDPAFYGWAPPGSFPTM